MGLLDALRGIKRPPPGASTCSAGVLRDALLALATKDEPYIVRRCLSDEPGELVAEWNIVDSRWQELFARAGLSKSFSIHLVFDEMRRSVRNLDRTISLEWRAGVPHPAVEGEVSWGRTVTKEAAIRFGFRDNLSFGPVYRYAFHSNDLKQPLWTTVIAHGWTWQPVGPGRL